MDVAAFVTLAPSSRSLWAVRGLLSSCNGHHGVAPRAAGSSKSTTELDIPIGSRRSVVDLQTCLFGSVAAAVVWRRRTTHKVRRRFVQLQDATAVEEAQDTGADDPGYLPPGVAKSMCSAVLTGAFQQRSLTPLVDLRVQRVLIVGMGSGAVPLWLQHTFPPGKLFLDIVENDKDVIDAVAAKFPEAAVRPVPTSVGGRALKGGDAVVAAAAAQDAIDTAEGLPIRIYNSDAGAFVKALAGKAPKSFRYNMVFLDADDKSPWVVPLLSDLESNFVQDLNQILALKATVGLNLVVDIAADGSDGQGEPPEVTAIVRRVRETCCGTATDIFSVRPPSVQGSGNKVYCFCCRGRPQYLRGGPSLKWSLQTNAQTLNLNFPVDSLGKKLRFDLATQVGSCYRDWPPGKVVTPDEPTTVYLFAAPILASVVYFFSQAGFGSAN